MKTVLIILVSFYQKALSPYLRTGCRFVPTCSTYMIDALQQKGAVKGLSAGVRRILRCHPFGGSGFDPVKK